MQRAARAFFERYQPGEPHRLDGDGDGVACKSLPDRQPIWRGPWPVLPCGMGMSPPRQRRLSDQAKKRLAGVGGGDPASSVICAPKPQSA